MTLWQAGGIEVNGLKLHYTRTGGAKPPWFWRTASPMMGCAGHPSAEGLAADYDVVMVDAPWSGRSAVPKQGYGSEDHAADLAGVIRALGLKRPAVLGHSMGAASTLVLAGMYHDLPPRPCLKTRPHGGRRPRRRGARRRLSALRRRGLSSRNAKRREELDRATTSGSPTWPEAELGPWADD